MVEGLRRDLSLCAGHGLGLGRDKEAVRVFPLGVRTGVTYGSKSSHQNLMNPFLYETRYSGFSIHINYKVIGLVLREI